MLGTLSVAFILLWLLMQVVSGRTRRRLIAQIIDVGARGGLDPPVERRWAANDAGVRPEDPLVHAVRNPGARPAHGDMREREHEPGPRVE